MSQLWLPPEKSPVEKPSDPYARWERGEEHECKIDLCQNGKCVATVRAPGPFGNTQMNFNAELILRAVNRELSWAEDESRRYELERNHARQA